MSAHRHTRRAAFDAACALAALGQSIHRRALIDRLPPRSDPLAIQNGLHEWLDANAPRGPGGSAPAGDGAWVPSGASALALANTDERLQDANARIFILQLQVQRLKQCLAQAHAPHAGEASEPPLPGMAELRDALRESRQREIALIAGLDAVSEGLERSRDVPWDSPPCRALSPRNGGRTETAPDTRAESAPERRGRDGPFGDPVLRDRAVRSAEHGTPQTSVGGHG